MRPGWQDRDKEYRCVQTNDELPGRPDSHDLRHVDALHVALDGNFHFNMKNKHTDPADLPLSMGASYFAHEMDFATYLAKIPKSKQKEVTQR